MNIHCNVSGTPTDRPTLVADTGAEAVGDLGIPGRCSFTVPDTINGGFTVRWDKREARSVFPQYPRHPNYEGGLLDPPLPTLTYPVTAGDLGHVDIRGDQFVLAESGQRWPWKGATDFRLLERLNRGQDIRPILEQRVSAGANLVRVLSMKANNTGWAYDPLRADWSRNLQLLHERTRELGLRVELTLFADTRVVMPDGRVQHAYFDSVVTAIQPFGWFLELVNEAGHPTQNLDPQQFARPAGLLSSHGSGGTDEDVVRPIWSYATYHAVRDTATARAFTNMDPYEFQRDFPVPPKIADEGAKPDDYGFNPDYAFRMGSHAAMGSGGTFHTNEGVNSDLWPPHIVACAEAFYRGTER